MAQCKDCIHNDLCKEMHKFGLVDLPYNDNAICDLFKSSADVVPKSEVEKLQNELVIWKQNRFNLYQRLELYNETRARVAREIFEDIRNTCGYSVAEHDGVVLYHTKCYSIMATKLDELEKKYTESEGKG